jgi:hypothetical protein
LLSTATHSKAGQGIAEFGFSSLSPEEAHVVTPGRHHEIRACYEAALALEPWDDSGPTLFEAVDK